MTGGRHPVAMFPFGSARSCVGPDPEWSELIESEHPVRAAVQDLLEPVQLRLAVRVGRFLLGGVGRVLDHVVRPAARPAPTEAGHSDLLEKVGVRRRRRGAGWP
jgi:hypothetical protein